jgi:hypothetical protein
MIKISTFLLLIGDAVATGIFARAQAFVSVK